MRHVTKLFSLFILSIICLLWTVYNFSQNKNYKHQHLLGSIRSKALTSRNNGAEDSMGCTFKELNPYTPEVMKLSKLDRSGFICSGNLPDLIYLNGTRIEIDMTRMNNVHNFKSCRYIEIFRHPSTDKSIVFGNWSEPFTKGIYVSDSTEFIHVVCENTTAGIISSSYHARIPKNEDIDELNQAKLRKRLAQAKPKETLSVIMIGMDGTSRHQLMRGMNRTYTYLMKDLNSFDMTMYTQVGSNTFPNMVPLLTGCNESEIEQWWNNNLYLDPLDTIWKDFNNVGYHTLFTEDNPYIGAFYYLKKGFLTSPVTYYSRPICVAMENDKDLWRSGSNCIGNSPEMSFHFDYIAQFLDVHKDTPVYAMAFLKKMTHDYMEDNLMADNLTFNFYKTLHEKGHLNKSLLITFSDHGPRWGAIRNTFNGMFESRTPYALFTFPQWFLDKYEDVSKNLRINTKRLTTHFDTHATLQDLIYFKGRTSLPSRGHGLSLFQEIPKNRTCKHIPIPIEFCLCDQEKVDILPKNSKISQGLANMLVDFINSKRNKTICAELRVKNILQIVTVKTSSLNVQDKRMFKVRVQTSFGDAIYEGTVLTAFCQDSELVNYFNLSEAGKRNETLRVTVGETVDRLNLYKGQADCETDSFKKPYCFCNDLI